MVRFRDAACVLLLWLADFVAVNGADDSSGKMCLRDKLRDTGTAAFDACTVTVQVESNTQAIAQLQAVQAANVAAVTLQVSHGAERGFYFKTETPEAAYEDLYKTAEKFYNLDSPNDLEEAPRFRYHMEEPIKATMQIVDDESLEAAFAAAREWGFKLVLVAEFDTQMPSTSPTQRPSMQPSVSPTAGPTALPTTQPSQQPTTQPSQSPTSDPTPFPTSEDARICQAGKVNANTVYQGYNDVLGTNVKTYCLPEDTLEDGYDEPWVLVWRHNYYETFASFKPTDAEIAKYAFFSDQYTPCDSKTKSCNLPNKKTAYGTPIQQMTVGYAHGDMKYAYMAPVSNYLDVKGDYRAAWLKDDIKLLDKCTGSSSQNVPPEPVDGSGNSIAGLTFDKANENKYTGNWDTDQYKDGSDKRGSLWPNCGAAVGGDRRNYVVEIYLQMAPPVPVVEKLCAGSGTRYEQRSSDNVVTKCLDLAEDSYGSWMLVWRHNYYETFAGFKPTDAEIAKYAFYSSEYIPCIADDVSCNLPNKKSAYGTPTRQMTVGIADGKIVYAYDAPVSEYLDQKDYRAAWLKDDRKLIDKCTSNNGIPPEPVDGTGNAVVGLTFDKANEGKYNGNWDTDQYGADSDKRGSLWPNCGTPSGSDRRNYIVEIYLQVTPPKTVDKLCEEAGVQTHKGTGRQSVCTNFSGDGYDKPWLLVWRHDYYKTFAAAKPTDAEIEKFAYYSSTYIPCGDSSHTTSCNLPAKKSAYGTPVRIMTVGKANGDIKYAYMGPVPELLDEKDYRSVWLKDDVKLIDKCATNNGIPPEPVDGTGNAIVGLTFDKANEGKYNGNWDSDQYEGSSKPGTLWPNCKPDGTNPDNYVIEIYIQLA